MRNAAAHFDEDFDRREPARKKPARRPAPGAKRKKGGRRLPFRLDMRRVARYGAIVACGAVIVGIMVNALVLQKSRHPAPLFGTSVALGEPKPVVPRPVPRPAFVPPAAPQDAAPPTARVPADSADPPAPGHVETPGAPAPDPIAALLSGAPIASDRPEAKTVVGVQRALAKLGFAVKPTGTFGPQTRKALEAFEKGRHLPVKDDLTRRVIKILAAESGLKIEH